MQLRLGIDMDGTLCDFVGAFLTEVECRYGLKISKEEILKPDIARFVNSQLKDHAKEKSEELYFEICTYDFFRNLKPFENTVEVVKELSKEHEIIFITRPTEYQSSTQAKKHWIEDKFGKTKYNLLFVDSFEAKRFVDVDLMIDDDPRVMSALEGQIPILVDQPWNRDYSKWAYRISSFSELAGVIEELK
jgi:5'(3')-deoxyribonucleotidase